jgi:hypothetical protein
MLLMLWKRFKVFTISTEVNLLWTPEEGELLLDELLENWVFLFVVSRYVNATTEEHRFTGCIV